MRMPGKLKKILWVVVPVLISGGAWYLTNHMLQEHYRKITVGRDTTYVTGPLFSDGTVDFLSALNGRFAEGVTPENNAAVPLYQATNPKDSLVGWRLDAYVKALGIPKKTDAKDSYVDFASFMLEAAVRVATHPRQVRNDEDLYRNTWSDRIAARAKVPWTREQDADAYGWLQRNEPVLQLVREASRRDRCYMPLIGNPLLGTTLDAMMGSMGQVRSYCNLLAVHGMLALGNHDFATWREDVLCVARLGRLIGRAPDMMQALVGLAVINMSMDMLEAALPQLSAAQARELLAELRRLPAVSKLADCDDQCQRLETIAEVCLMARFGPAAAEMDRSGSGAPLPAPASFGFQPPIHFDALLRQFNGLYDRRVAAQRLPTYSQRVAALQALDADLATQAAAFSGKSSTAAIQRLILFAVSGAKRICVLQDKAVERCRLAELALLLAAYRGEHGGYPDSLKETPELAAVDHDVFADDGPVHFSKVAAKVYSVGPNQRDDGGVYNPPKPKGLSLNSLEISLAGPGPDFPEDIVIRLP
jgi:hypothetical protein